MTFPKRCGRQPTVCSTDPCGEPEWGQVSSKNLMGSSYPDGQGTSSLDLRIMDFFSPPAVVRLATCGGQNYESRIK